METYLIYISKVALAAGVFYLVYLALFQNQKQFTFNRIYLPVSLALSFIIPLITLTTVNYVEPVSVESNPLPVFTESFEPVIMQESQRQFIWEWYHYLFALYAAGTFLFLFRLLLGHGKAWNIIRNCRVHQLFNSLVNISKKDIHPFSFFNKIVLSENTLSHPNLKIIVEHENIHVKEKHTLDILFTEILFLLQWFNPFAWLLKDAVKNNLEYKTDHEIAKTTDAQTYQLAMLALADKQGVAPFLTALNGSQLRNRIIMMKKKTENKYARLKQLAVLPLLAVLVMGLAEREVRTEFFNPDKKVEIFVNDEEININHEALIDINLSKSIDAKQIINALHLENVKATRLEESADITKLYIRTGDYLPENMKLEVYLNGEKIPSTNPNLNKIDLTKPINRNEIISALNIDDILVTSMQNNIDGYSFYVKTKDYKPGENKEKAIPHLSLSNILRSLSNITFNINKTSNEKTQKERVEEYLFDFSKLNIVVDGIEIPKDSPELNDIKITEENLHNSKYVTEIVDALNIDLADIKASRSSNNPNDPFVYIRTKNYVPGTNLEFEKRTETLDTINQKLQNKKNSDSSGSSSGVINSTGDFDNTKEPMYVVDGKITKTINQIPPEDIESIDVLKNETATDLYGPNAKNGALLITTKSKSYSYLNDDAQIVRPQPKEKFVLPEVMPEFPGGDETLRQYIADNINYPESARENGIQGTAYVSFKVTKEGEVTNVRLARGVHPPLDREAIRVVESMPDWKPGMTNGQPVDVPALTVPVNFTIENPVVKVKSYAQSLVIPGPLYIVDGEETSSIKDIPHEDIKHIDVLNSASSTALYGQRGKDGVILITTKQGAPENKLITELQLRKFIAEHIKYPVEAQRKGLHGMVSMVIDPGASNQIVARENYSWKDVHELGWVVATGYGGDTPPSGNPEKDSPLLFAEVERVLQMLPKVNIPTIDKKLIRVNVEFKLQRDE